MNVFKEEYWRERERKKLFIVVSNIYFKTENSNLTQ